MIKTLLKSVREYKIYSILCPLVMIVEVLMEVFLVFVNRDMINLMESSNPEISQVLIYGAVLLVMAMISLAAGILRGILGAKASTGFAKNLRQDLYNKIQDFSFSNIDDFQTSSLVTRLTTDIQNIQMAYQMCLRIVIRCPLMLILSITMSFIINAELAAVYAAFIPILGIVLFAIIYVVMPIFTRVFKQYDKLNNSVQENVRGIRVVKAYVREDFEKQKFAKASDDLTKQFIKAERILAWNNPVMQFCIQVSMLLICYLGAKVACTHTNIFSGLGTNFGVGELSSLNTYGIQMLSSMMMLAMIFVMMSLSIESMRRVYEVLKTESNLTNPENPVMEVKNGDIDFNHVSFKYSNKAEKYVLQDIDVHIKSGQTVGILGSTGSGKTSLVNLISRLYDVTEGDIKVGDIDVRNYDLNTLRNNIAVVLQKNVLFSGTIKENMRWGKLDATDEEIVAACKTACADEFVSQFPDKYDTYIEEGGTNVSGGQKQRLCIARALLKNPKVLILDDSTSAVDTKTDSMIRAALKKNNPDVTKIIVAQRIQSVQEADQIIVMNNGRIDDIGTHEELMKKSEVYRSVYYAQNKGGAKDVE